MDDIKPTCSVCGHPLICACWKVTFTTNTSSSTTISADAISKFIKGMHNWKVTLHGQLDDTRTPVPTPFQEAFKDGELEV